MRCLAALIFALFAAACESTPDSVELAQNLQPRTVWIVGGDGRSVGEAVFTEAPSGVLIRLAFSPGRLPPGWHGLHLHTTGDCSDFAAGFQNSGDHVTLNRRTQHGLLNRRGPEAGDLPNIFIAPNAPSGAQMFSPYVTLHTARVGNRLPLLDGDGAALLIHTDPDDQNSQPIGNAGARIACAALTQLP